MKYLCQFLVICILSFSIIGFADQGDTPTDQTNAVWLITSQKIGTTPFMTYLLDKMGGIPEAFAAWGTMNKFVPWMEIEIAGAFDKVFPTITYQTIVGKIEGYEYHNPHISAVFLAPENAAVDGSTITCNADGVSVTPRDVLLYKLSSGQFTEQAAGAFTTIWTFSGLSAGNYILVFDDLTSLPTVLLVVS